MKAHRGQTPLTEWLNGEEHTSFLSRISYTARLQPKAPAKEIYIRGMEGVVLILSEEDRKILYDSCKNGSYADFTKQFIIPKDSQFIAVGKKLDDEREFYRSFFKYLIENKRVHERMFNGIIMPFLNKEIKFLVRHDPFHPKLEWEHNLAPITLQDYIDFNYIIKPGLNERDDTFAMMRICQKCRKFFVARTNKTIFCSPSCRVIYQRQHGPEK